MDVVKIIPVPIRDFDFSSYGQYIALKENSPHILTTITDAFVDRMTKDPLIDTLGHLGLTTGQPAPYRVESMEKHHHTKEAIVCIHDPILLCVANSVDEDCPIAQDVRAVLLSPGDVVILNRNIWHDACRGIQKKSDYLWFASAGKTPPVWSTVQGIANVTLDEAGLPS